MSTAELACTYAALILHDDGIAITADKLATLIRAAGVEEFEPIWAQIFTRALQGKNLDDLISNVGSGAGAPVAAAAAPAAAAPAAKEEKKEEAKGKKKEEEKKEESDEDMGFGLFD